jgi:hypothetical protein
MNVAVVALGYVPEEATAGSAIAEGESPPRGRPERA